MPAGNPEPLTSAQQELYDWLADYIGVHRHSPSIRQMMEAIRLHAEVTGDGPDGQTGGALGRQLPAAQRDDLRLDALPRLLALAHPASVTQTENTALDFPATRWHSGFRERCSHF